jgi:hypothetical protein
MLGFRTLEEFSKINVSYYVETRKRMSIDGALIEISTAIVGLQRTDALVLTEAHGFSPNFTEIPLLPGNRRYWHVPRGIAETSIAMSFLKHNVWL